MHYPHTVPFKETKSQFTNTIIITTLEMDDDKIIELD